MGSLGDAFPQKFKTDYAESRVQCGSVIFLRDDIADKDKIHVIVGFDRDKILAAAVRINTEINANIYRTDELKRLCHHISAEKAAYLHHDSFVSCKDIIEWNREVLVNLVESEPGIVFGVMDTKDLEIVQYLISTAKTISPKIKKKFGLFNV